MSEISNEIVIEFGGDKNQYFLFAPTGQRLRGRWTLRNELGSSSSAGFTQMPDIPGMCVAVDLKKKSFRVFDPLSLRENKDILEKANKIASTWFGDQKAWPDSFRDGLPGWELKSLLWKMREHVEAGDARLLHGEMPTKQQILAMTGKLKLRWWDLREKVDKFATEEELQQLSPNRERESRESAAAR